MTWNLNFFSNFEQYSFPASFWIHPRYFPAHHQYFLQYHQRYWLWYATHATHASKFFFLSRFSFTDTDDSQDSRGKGVDHLLFHSTTSTRSQTSRHLFATLHVRWLSRIFNRNACAYQTAARWDLPFYRMNILIDWLHCQSMFVCLLNELILGFCYSDLTWETGGFELALTVTLVLQATGIHPNNFDIR